MRRTLWFYGWNTTVNRMQFSYLKYYGNYPTYRYNMDGNQSDAAYNQQVTNIAEIHRKKSGTASKR
ncbi:MAG TPA: hypothetical protein VIK74_05605 [Parasegetibacter sp.]